MERPKKQTEPLDLIYENVMELYVDELENRLTLIQDLAIGYDGFNTVEGLKSLIDDIVKASKGELEIEK